MFKKNKLSKKYWEMCVPQRLLRLATLSSFASGSRSISSANEVCAIDKWWEVHASEWHVRRGWNRAWRRGGIRSISSSCHFLQPVWEQKQFARISGFQSPVHTWGQLPFPAGAVVSVQRSPSGFTVEAQQDCALEAFCICECVGWSCVWGADNPEQCLSGAGSCWWGRRAQLSAAES